MAWIYSIGFSLAAGVMCGSLVVGLGVVMDRRIRRKLLYFFRILSVYEVASLVVTGTETMQVQGAENGASNVALGTTEGTNADAVASSTQFCVIRRQDDPSQAHINVSSDMHEASPGSTQFFMRD